jgi:archaellum component FlaF (FlaF/FlaG flagellin family)
MKMIGLASLLVTVFIYVDIAESLSIWSKGTSRHSIQRLDEHSNSRYHRSASTTVRASVTASTSTGENIKLTDIKMDGEVVSKQTDDVIYPNSNKKFFIETHGCQMNLADSEVIRSVLLTEKYVMCDVLEDADLILTNTCSIRSVQSLAWK